MILLVFKQLTGRFCIMQNLPALEYKTGDILSVNKCFCG